MGASALAAFQRAACMAGVTMATVTACSCSAGVAVLMAGHRQWAWPLGPWAPRSEQRPELAGSVQLVAAPAQPWP